MISARELLSVNAALSVKRQRQPALPEIGELGEVDEAEELEADGGEKKKEEASTDEVDKVANEKELTDFELIMEIRLLELVYSHLQGECYFSSLTRLCKGQELVACG